MFFATIFLCLNIKQNEKNNFYNFQFTFNIMKRRILIYPAIILFFYLFRAIDLLPLEMNFDFTSWGKSKLIRWGVLSLIGISVEEYFIRRKSSKLD